MRPAFFRLFFFILGWTWFSQPIYLLSQNSIYLRDVKFIGLKKTKPQALLRFLEFEPYHVIAPNRLPQLLEQSSRNIYNTGLFNKVEIQDTLIEDSLSLQITVKERWYIFPQPYFLLEERTFTDFVKEPSTKRLTYGMGVDWQNFTGRLDNLWAGFTLGYSKRFFGYYFLPYAFPKSKIDISFWGLYQKNKEVNIGSINGKLIRFFLNENDFQETHKYILSFSKRVSNIEKVTFELGYTYKSFHDSLYFFRENYLTNRKGIEYYPTFRLIYIYDKRDVYAFPLEGYKFFASAEYNGLGKWSSTNFIKLKLNFSQFHPIKKRWNFGYAGYFHQSFGYKIPYYDKFFIGFSDFLRGYEKYVIDGTTIFMIKTDFKFAVVPKRITSSKMLSGKFKDFPFGIYLVWLNDLGMVNDLSFNNDDPFLKNQWLYSTGWGIQIPFIYDSLFRFEYTYNHLKEWNWFFDLVIPLR
jgi:outer membrane protein assembly factor BamA